MLVNELIGANVAVQQAGGVTRHRSLGDLVLLQLAKMWFQIAGGLLFAVVIPALVGNRFYLINAFNFQDPALIGTLWAFLIGYIVFRKVTAYPGVRATAFIVPAFFGAYAFVAGFILLMRLPYSTVQFALSLTLSVAFFYAVFFLVRRAKLIELSIIPVGDFRRLFQLSNVGWRTIPTPEADGGRTPIVVDLRTDLSPDWERFITDSALAGRPIYSAKQVFESLSGRVLVEHLSENTFGSVTTSSIYASAKRQSDCLLAIIMLALLFPFLLIIGFLIRVSSNGPALFRQQRMGFRGRRFTVYKFRTMRVVEGPASALSEMTLPEDARVTPIGRFLRRTRIDELPQMLNIVRGQMSWIGPRPEAINLSSLYETNIPFYRYRHLVRPGITGWAQVHQGHVTSLEDIDIKLQYDFFYVKHFSLWLDILVVLKTLKVVFTGNGAR